MKKQIFFTVLFFLAALPAGAQLYQPGEVLDYRASYKAKFFPNTEVGSVRVTTVEEEYEGEPMYRIVAHGKTLPAFRWVMNVDDKYTILVDREELKTRRFESDIREGNYRFWSNYVYDWPEMTVHTRWQGRRMVRDTTKTMSLTPRSMDPVSLYFHLRSIDPATLQEGKTEVLEMLLEDTIRHLRYRFLVRDTTKTMSLTPRSMDPVSLYFHLRSIDPATLQEGKTEVLEMLLEDTIRHLRYRFLGRETKKIRSMGTFRTLKFACQIGTSEGYSFTDGTEFTVWISDDKNLIPLYIESPVRIGSVQAYISGYHGLKYPLSSKIK